MYYDLNIAWPVRIPPAGNGQAGSAGGAAASKKQKGKQSSASGMAGSAGNEHVKTGTEALTAGDRQELEKAVKMAIKRESGLKKPLANISG